MVESKSVTISVALVTYPSMKITVERRREELCASLLCAFLKELRLFHMTGEHWQPPFFILEKIICKEAWLLAHISCSQISCGFMKKY